MRYYRTRSNGTEGKYVALTHQRYGHRYIHNISYIIQGYILTSDASPSAHSKLHNSLPSEPHHNHTQFRNAGPTRQSRPWNHTLSPVLTCPTHHVTSNAPLPRRLFSPCPPTAVHLITVTASGAARRDRSIISRMMVLVRRHR